MQGAAVPAAAVEGGRVLAHPGSPPPAVVASDDAGEPVEGFADRGEVAGPPPQGVALLGKRARGVDAGGDEKESAFGDVGGAAQRDHQFAVAGPRMYGGAHGAREPRDPERAVATDAARRFRVRPVPQQGRGDSLAEHPVEHLAGVPGELKLQEAAPHLLLRAAQVDDRGHAEPGRRQQLPAEPEHVVHGPGNVGPDAQEVAQIDQPIPDFEAPAKLFMERREAPGLAANGPDRPDAAGARETREYLGLGRLGAQGALTSREESRPAQAARSMSSRRSVAAASSIRSTAASSRARRSRADS